MTKQYDKAKFEENQLRFYEELGKSRAYGEILRTMPFGNQYKAIDAKRVDAINEMKRLDEENAKILGI